MPGTTESSYPQDWFRIAAEDLRRVRRRLEEGDIDDAAFRLQQAVEKYLKGYLLQQGWRLQRIHDLEVLLTEAARYNRQLETYRPLCRQVANYYLIERYPLIEEGPTRNEVQEAYRTARALVARLVPHRRRRRHE